MLFFVILATLMVPVAAVLAPTYLTVNTIGDWPVIGNWIDIDTYLGLILPSAVSPLGVFMMRQFIETLPDGLYEAARLDGAGEWRIFTKIVLPLIKPALVVLGIFVFMLTWASYLWPLVAATDNEFRVLTVGIASLKGQFVTGLGDPGGGVAPDDRACDHRLPVLPEVVRAGVDGRCPEAMTGEAMTQRRDRRRHG